MTTGPSITESHITRLLAQVQDGDEKAREHLAEAIYPHLKRIAGARLSSFGKGRALQTTELVHETYLRLLGQRQGSWQDRAHFFAIAARLMRRTLLEDARFRQRAKRGGDQRAVPLDQITLQAGGIDADAVVLDQALGRLRVIDHRAAQVVELRFYAGMSVDEVATSLGIGRATVSRDWRFAKRWLRIHLSQEP